MAGSYREELGQRYQTLSLQRAGRILYSKLDLRGDPSVAVLKEPTRWSQDEQAVMATERPLSMVLGYVSKLAGEQS